MKANFKIKKNSFHDHKKNREVDNPNKGKKITQEEFEEFISKSGAAGSFMIFRSDNKKEELGLDEL